MAKSIVTQNETVLMHLQQFGDITAMQAFTRYQITRLSARIFDLKKAGHTIDAAKQRNDGEGQSGCYARYVLIKGQ